MGLEFASGKGTSATFGKGYGTDGHGNIKKIAGMYFRDNAGIVTKIYENLGFAHVKQLWSVKTSASGNYLVACNNQGDLYAVSSDSHSVGKYDTATGRLIWKFQLPGYGFLGLTVDAVQSLATDSSGSLYIGSNNGLTKVNKSGSKITTILGSTGVYAIACDPSGNVYAATSGNTYKYDINMKQLWSSNTGTSQIGAITIGGNGDIYVGSNGQLNQIDGTSGANSNSWNLANSFNEFNIIGLASYSTNIIAAGFYMTASDTGNVKVISQDVNSSTVTDLTANITNSNVARSIAVDEGQNAIFGGDGGFFMSVKSKANFNINWSTTLDNTIESIAVGPNGIIYVATQGPTLYAFQEY